MAEGTSFHLLSSLSFSDTADAYAQSALQARTSAGVETLASEVLRVDHMLPMMLGGMVGKFVKVGVFSCSTNLAVRALAPTLALFAEANAYQLGQRGMSLVRGEG